MQAQTTQPLQTKRDAIITRMAWLLPFLLAVALYGRAVGLPFYSDDIEFYPYLAQITPLEIFTRADANGMYFRPVPMFFYYVLPPDSALWHMLLLATHLLNVALVGALARVLGVGKGAAVLAMSAFALFPFNVQAVLWVLSWGHVLSTCALLLAVYATLAALRGRSHWRWVAVAAGCLAPFTHENGILAVVLMGGVSMGAAVGLWGMRWRHAIAKLVGMLSPVAAVAAGYWVYRASLVSTRVSVGDDLLERLWRGGAYFVQGITLPVQVLFSETTTATQAWLGAGAFFAVAGALLLRPQALETPYKRLQKIGREINIADTLLVQFLTHATHAARTRRRVALGALLAWGVCALPTVIALPSSYNMLYDERLLYVSAPTVAIFWGVLLMTLKRPLLRWGVAGVWLLLLWQVAQVYVGYTVFMGDGWAQFFRLAASLPDDTRGVVVNMPRLIEHPHHVLPLMRPNAQMMQHDFSLRDILWTNTRRELAGWQGLNVPEALQFADFAFPLDVWRDYIGYGTFATRADVPLALREADALAVFDVAHGRYDVRLLGQRADSDAPPLAVFSEQIALLAVEEVQTAVGWRVALTWRAIAPSDAPLVAFVHGLCGEALLAQDDSLPLGGWHPFSAWAAGETWTEYRTLTVAAPDAACRALRVGVYDARSGQPLIGEGGERAVIKRTFD